MDNTHDTTRSLIAVTGEDGVHFLQGLLTNDVTKLAQDSIQFTALLSPQGKILHDLFLIAANAVEGLAPGTILLDTPTLYRDLLLKRLALYKLRSKVAFTTLEGWSVSYTQHQGLADPRHPDLPHRHYSPLPASSILSVEQVRAQSLALGIPDSTLDFAPDEVVAPDAGYDLLHAISFTKGCYIGQEITARMHYKNIARRGFYILTQGGIPKRLALLKFADMEKAGYQIELDGKTYHAHLPEWMQPKLLLAQQAP